MSRSIKKIVIRNFVAKHMHKTCHASSEVNLYRAEKVHPTLIQIELDDKDHTGQMADTFDFEVLAEGHEDWVEYQNRNNIEDRIHDEFFRDPDFDDNDYEMFDDDPYMGDL